MRRSFVDTLRDLRSGEVLDQLDDQLQELVRDVYDGSELRPYEGRPGAMRAFALPSLIGGRRVARKSFVGNETEVV